MLTKTKTGRNDLCPCESGLKFKHCHGCELKTAIAKQIANEAMLLLIAETRLKKEIINEGQFSLLTSDPKLLIIQLIRQFSLVRCQDCGAELETKCDKCMKID